MVVWEAIVDMMRGKTLDRMTLAELRRDRITLEQKEREHIQNIQKLEREQKDILAAGMKEPSQHMKMAYARKVTEKDSDIRMNERLIKSLQHQMRITNGIMMVKRWSEITSENKDSLLSRLSLAELTKYVHDKTVQGEFKDEYLEELSGALERGIGVITDVGSGEDANVRRVFDLMNKAASEGVVVDKLQEEVKTTLENPD